MNCAIHSLPLAYRLKNTNNAFCKECVAIGNYDKSLLIPIEFLPVATIDYANIMKDMDKWANIPFTEVSASLSLAFNNAVKGTETMWNGLTLKSRELLIELNALIEEYNKEQEDNSTLYSTKNKKINDIKTKVSKVQDTFDALLGKTSKMMCKSINDIVRTEINENLFNLSKHLTKTSKRKERSDFDSQKWLEEVTNEHMKYLPQISDSIWKANNNGCLCIEHCNLTNQKDQILDLLNKTTIAIELNDVIIDTTESSVLIATLVKKNILSLQFTNMYLSDNFLELLNEFTDQMGLHELQFNKCKLGRANVKVSLICNFIEYDHKSLATLRIIDCGILDHICQSIADSLKFNKHLSVLDLSKNPLTKVGLSDLLSKKALNSYSITELCLSGISGVTPLSYPEDIVKL